MNESLVFKHNLESIFYKSPKLEISLECYFQITHSEIISYKRCSHVLDKHGICIISLNYQDNSDTFKQLIQGLGILHAHSNQDSFLWNIKVSSENKDTQVLARSDKDHEFDFHTDCSYEEDVPDYVALYVLQADQKMGGKNLIIDSKLLLNALSKKSLKILQNFPVTIKVPREFFKGKDSIKASVIDANFNIRFRREIIDTGKLTFKQLTALEELESLIYSTKYSRQLLLKNDQILILNNKRFLHARTAIRDLRRHLQRIRFFYRTNDVNKNGTSKSVYP